MRANRKFIRDEEAVSPVIGVILMVAITVILAAVIAAFVFGMGGNLKKNYVVAATASQVGKDIVVVYQGGPDHDEVEWFIISEAGNFSKSNRTVGTQTVSAVFVKQWPTVGETKKFTKNDPENTGGLEVGSGGHNDPVVASVRFKDGTTQVILNTLV